MINEGDKVPALSVTDSDGGTVDLSAPGQSLVVFFYPKDDTSGCTREAKDFTALADQFRAAGAKVIGVSRDPMARHERFIGKYGLKVPLVSMRTVAFRMPSAPGSRRACTAANIWGWSAPPS
jgi:thioredoxin-dependent peroxiredoxin